MAAPTTRVLKAVTVKAGEKFVIPSGASVDSVLTTGNAVITADCTLPVSSAYKCGFFYIIVDQDDNEEHSMNERNTRMIGLSVGGVDYPINKLVVEHENGAATPQKLADMNAAIASAGALFQFTKVTMNQAPSRRQEVWYYFKYPEKLKDSIELEVKNFESTHYYRPVDVDCNSYPFGLNKETLFGL